MTTTIQNTGIVSKTFNSRGLICHNAVTHTLVRASDGTLWACVGDNVVNKTIKIFRSTDNGFSWEKMWSGTLIGSSHRTGVAGLNQNGRFMFLQIYESLDRLILWHSYYDLTTDKFDLECMVWRLTDNPLRRLDLNDTAEGIVSQIALDADQLAIAVPHNENVAWIFYTTFGQLKVKQYRPTIQTTAEWTATATGSYYNSLAASACRDGYADIAILTDSTLRKLQFLRYSQASGAFSTPVDIYATGGEIDIVDVSISRDGHENLLVIWSEHNLAGTSVDARYSLSSNNGATWSAVETIPFGAGHSVYTDVPTGQKAARTVSMGGRQGFVLSYCRNNPAGVPKTWVRSLLTTDGTNYVLGAEREIATRVAQATDPVVGLRFFMPPAAKLLDLSDPGQVRVAYQVGEGNSTVQNDVKPVRIGQELLAESAYPIPLASEASSYSLEGAVDNQLLATVNILGGTNSNVDYFDLGLVGHSTERYMAAFGKIGTQARLLQYEPIPTSEMGDRSAFDPPVEHTTTVIFESHSYAFPLASRGSESYTSFIERDVRKLFLPPNFPLTRTLVVNAGNFLKRTVWTMEFDGNAYELTQVVPVFINDEIAHYEANAYVVGPSHDPFARTILPSET